MESTEDQADHGKDHHRAFPDQAPSPPRGFRLLLDGSASLALNGHDLKVEEVVEVARRHRKVEIAPDARQRMERCRAMVDVLLDLNEKVYGLTTGFGKLRDVLIPKEDAQTLQRNLLVSHSCGVGPAFSEEVVRAAILLRINTLCRGNSGIRVQVVEQLCNLLNSRIYPYIPEKGSVGASGDLSPLSHLGLVLMGETAGKYLPRSRRHEDGSAPSHPDERDFEPMPSPAQLEAVAAQEGWSFRPMTLEAKEGLAINNGTQFMTALAALALYDGFVGLRTAEVAGALSLEANRGVRGAYDPRMHRVRPHEHQAETAMRIISFCAGSQILDLYLNSGHLYQAERALAETEKILRDAGRQVPPFVAGARALIPTTADGVAEPVQIAAWSRLPAREQIDLFKQRLEPLRDEARRYLHDLEEEKAAPGATPIAAREALQKACRHLKDAVPSAPLVQDDYSFRCFPQVLACAWRSLWHVADIVAVEMNSANDNPLLFPPEAPAELESTAAYAAWLRDPARLELCRQGVLGGGNFHGEPIAIAMDYLAIAVAEVASIAERRIAHLVDENASQGLPPFLIDGSGLNSGFMIPQYTAAALVSENKVLCHPASVDSIPTCANSEDHVSMGTIAARKGAQVLDNVIDVIAIEILSAYQGLHFRLPLQPGEPLRRVIQALNDHDVKRYSDDRAPYLDFRRVRDLVLGGELLRAAFPP